MALSACGRAIAPLVEPQRSSVALTGGPSTSMMFLARTDEGIVVIDLGWWGHKRAVERALGELGATPAGVRHVFLTHSHRDHIGAWQMVKHGQFHVGPGERSRLLGLSRHRGWIARWADILNPPTLPAADSLDVREFSRDTAFVFGRDTVFAYPVTGHTPGAAVYLFRGMLFVGDAVGFTRWSGFSSARPGYSDDPVLAAESLRELWPRLPNGAVRYVCTAHAHCTPLDDRFREDVAR